MQKSLNVNVPVLSPLDKIMIGNSRNYLKHKNQPFPQDVLNVFYCNVLQTKGFYR